MAHYFECDVVPQNILKSGDVSQFLQRLDLEKIRGHSTSHELRKIKVCKHEYLQGQGR